MSRRAITFIGLAALALAAGLIAYAGTRLALRAPAPAEAASSAGQLTWLAREFRLTPAQTAEIDRLQTAYAPICAGHCIAIIDAQDALASADTPAGRADATAELARLKAVCAASTRAHLQSVAACMPPAQATRFLALMEPRVAHTDDRTGAPALSPTSPR